MYLLTDDLFRVFTKDEMARLMAEFLPGGRAWDKKYNPESNMYKFLKGLSPAYIEIQKQINNLKQEFNINTTVDLIDKWEASVGLPDICLGPLTDIRQRREYVIARFRKTPIVTLQEIESILRAFFPDTQLNLYSGHSYYGFERTFERSFGYGLQSLFIIVVELDFSGTTETYEYTFEHKFAGGINSEQIKCFLKNFISANVLIVITYTT